MMKEICSLIIPFAKRIAARRVGESTMAITTSFKQECPICEALVPIRDPKLIGKKIKCPKCEGTFVVKEPPEPEGEDDEEEGIATKPSKKSKSGGNGKVTDTKPAKASAKKGKDDDGESNGEEKAPRKKKKQDNKIMLGLILAGVAVVVLGVGGYFMFRGDSKPKKNNPVTPPNAGPVIPDPNKDGDKKDEGDKTAKKPAGKSDLVDLANLLPADATAVFYVNFKGLKDSKVWTAALRADGAYRDGAFERLFGFPLYNAGDGVERVITALNRKADWVFSVMRTVQPVDQDDLKTRLRMAAVADKPYFLLGRQFDNIGNMLFKANRPRESYAAYFVDSKTIIFADVDPLERFVAEKTAAEKKEGDAGLGADLKALLDKVESGDAPALICAAGDAETAWAATRPLLPRLVMHGSGQLAPLLANNPVTLPNVEELPKHVKEASTKPDAAIRAAEGLVREEVNSAAVALLSFTSEKIDVRVAVEMKSESTASSWYTNYIKPVLDLWGNTQFQPGGPERPGMGVGMGEQPKKEVPLSVSQSGKFLTATFATSIKSEYSGYADGLAKAMARARGESEMTNTAPRYHQLAAALMKYVEKNEGKFPRGTAPRKNAKDGDVDFRHPDERVSWMAALLPYLPEADFRAVKVDPSREWFKDDNLTAAQTVVPHYVVRGKDTAFRTTLETQTGEFGVTHFLGMAGVGRNAARYARDDKDVADKIGIFGYDRVTKVADIPKDRLGKVIAVIQVPPEYRAPWLSGGGATIRGVADDKTAVQEFVSTVRNGERGTFAIMADGKVRFIRATIDPRLFRSMCVIQAPTDKEVLDLLAKFNELVPEVPDEEVAVKVIGGAADKPGQEKPPEKPKDKTPPDKTPPDKTPPDKTPPDKTLPDRRPPDSTLPDKRPPKGGDNPIDMPKPIPPKGAGIAPGKG
jgi:hypothetical protein